MFISARSDRRLWSLRTRHKDGVSSNSRDKWIWYWHGYTMMTSSKWKHFPRYWPFVRGIHRSPVNSPHKGQWRGALMFTLICARINACVNNREAGDLRRYRPHYDVIVMTMDDIWFTDRWTFEWDFFEYMFCIFLCSAPWIFVSYNLISMASDMAFLYNVSISFNLPHMYLQIYNISRTKSENVNFSRFVLQLS